MNLLLLGSGGREHAFAWKLKQSQLCEKLFIAPGNAGTAQCGTNVPLDVNDFPNIGKFCIENKIDLVMVGPEDPLINGIYDYFQTTDGLKDIQVVGPSKDGAQLEGSKAFAKEFMNEFKIPTAPYKTFNDACGSCNDAINYISQKFDSGMRVVIKASGPALGKGVLLPKTKEEAFEALNDILVKKIFGAAGNTVVIEDFMPGIEFSVFVFTDGINYKILPTAKDYKRIGEGDTGLNTGGMGSISPVLFVDTELMSKVEERVVKPTLFGLHKRGITYKGFIYIGFMSVGDEQEPFVVEYNCRMGDPETQVVLPMITSDLLSHLVALNTGNLSNEKIEVRSAFTAAVVLASGGYPGNYEKGKEITLPESKIDSYGIIFHAGTKISDNKLVTSGGRVMAIVQIGSTIDEAVSIANSYAEKVKFEGKYFRKDIGFEFKVNVVK